MPGIEKVGEKQAVKKTEVRYFNDSDKVHADQVQSIVTQNGFPTAAVVRNSLKAKPRQVEVWFAPSD